MASAARITVAGAGVLGLACALELAQAGCRVTVCDPGPPGGGASGVAAGMLAPVFEAVLDPLAAPHFDLLMAVRDLWPGLGERSGVYVDRAGALAAGDAVWLADIAAAMVRLGVHAADLPIDAAAGMAPGLSQDLDGALLNREDWRVDAGQALPALRRAVEASGGVFRTEAVTGLGDADFLVIATGAGRGLAAIAPELAALQPVKGHIVRTRINGQTAVVVRGQGAYASPTSAGLLVGATMEPGLADTTIDTAKVAPLLTAGARLFPAIAGAPREVLAGVRAATPDGLPLVGASVTPRVLVAAGARRNGWLLAPLVARVIAAQVLGRDPGPAVALFDPERFSTV